MDLPHDPKQWVPLKMKAPTLDKDLQFDISQKYFVVHPGMGGSALNWPTQRYFEHISQLSEKAIVVITGTKSDESYLAPLKQSLKDNHQVVWLDKQLDGYQLLKLLSNAITVTAPSTGVLHLSASLGVPSLGIYSPIKVHRDSRWGPKGEKVHTFTPEVEDAKDFESLRNSNIHHPCMERLESQILTETSLSYLTH